MPLTNSPNGTYQTPDQDEPAQMDYWLAESAKQVEAKALHHTSATRKRVHVSDPITATTDASGYATMTHGAPFTPRLVECHIVRNAISLGQVISCEVIGTTQAQARFAAWNATTTLNSASLGAGSIVLVCWE